MEWLIIPFNNQSWYFSSDFHSQIEGRTLTKQIFEANIRILITPLMILTHLNMMLFAQLDKQLAHEFLRDVFSIKF